MTILALLAMAPLPASKVIDALENHYQPLFQDMALTKPTKWKVSRAGKPDRIVEGQPLMGGSRMEVWELIDGGHGMIQFPVRRLDKRLEKHAATRKAAQVALQEWRDRVYLVGNKTEPIKPESLTLRTRTTTNFRAGRFPKDLTPKEILEFAGKALWSGGKLTARKNDWTVAVSPIVFKDAQCLSCHTKSKKGDLAGMLVYTLHPDPKTVVVDPKDMNPTNNRKAKVRFEKGNELAP